jgi:hypothetical protein
MLFANRRKGAVEEFFQTAIVPERLGAHRFVCLSSI